MKIVFVKRPKVERGIAMMDALRATAKNGKAVRLTHQPGGGYTAYLRRDGLVLHQTRRGKFILAWCENGSKKKGAR